VKLQPLLWCCNRIFLHKSYCERFIFHKKAVFVSLATSANITMKTFNAVSKTRIPMLAKTLRSIAAAANMEAALCLAIPVFNKRLLCIFCLCLHASPKNSLLVLYLLRWNRPLAAALLYRRTLDRYQGPTSVVTTAPTSSSFQSPAPT
jgi:hypothetical protein